MSNQQSQSMSLRHSLREAVISNESTKQPLLGSLLTRVVNVLSGAFTALFPPPKANSMCKYYGHIVDKKNWGKGLPNCLDCGKQIHSRDELRGSNVKKDSKTK